MCWLKAAAFKKFVPDCVKALVSFTLQKTNQRRSKHASRKGVTHVLRLCSFPLPTAGIGLGIRLHVIPRCHYGGRKSLETREGFDVQKNGCSYERARFFGERPKIFFRGSGHHDRTEARPAFTRCQRATTPLPTPRTAAAVSGVAQRVTEYCYSSHSLPLPAV